MGNSDHFGIELTANNIQFTNINHIKINNRKLVDIKTDELMQ